MSISLQTSHLHSLGLSLQPSRLKLRPFVLFFSQLDCEHHIYVKGLYNIKNFCYSPNKHFRNPSEMPRETFRLGAFDLEELEKQEKRILITSSYLGRVCLSCLSKIRANRLEWF